LLIEPPDLSLLTILGLDDHVSVVDDLKISSRSQSRLNVEWSLDVKSVFFIEFSLSRFTLPLIGIDDVPLLCDSIISLLISSNVLVFDILVVEDRHITANEKADDRIAQQWDVVYADEWKGEPGKGELNEEYGLYI
jgi:hypothetical protein